MSNLPSIKNSVLTNIGNGALKVIAGTIKNAVSKGTALYCE